MKTTNQFDYPTAVASNYKAFREQPANPNPNNKQHYQNVIKQESTNERGRVKYEQQKKRQMQKSQQQKRLKQQIQRKKRQLQELEQKRMEAVQNQMRAAELAKIKDEQDKIKRIQQMEKTKEADSNAQFRFKDALRRLEAEKDQSSYKERQAQHRRKVNIEIEKEERQRANKFRSLQSIRQQEQRVRAQEEQRKNEELYRQGLGRHGLAKNIDYSKTCFHNPTMIFKNESSEITAIEKAQIQQQIQKSHSIDKIQREERSKQRSIERHQKAMQKIQNERQYHSYCAETQQQQIQYNLNRIEAGKKNQFTGMKPLTLDQMQINKKIRSQQEFEDMFIQAPQIQNSSYPANHYSIVQNQYSKPIASSYQNWKRGKLDMTQQNEWKPTNYPQYEMQNSEEDVEQRYISEVPRPIQKLQKQQIDDAKLKIEAKSERKQNNHEQLSYSQSEEDSIM